MEATIVSPTEPISHNARIWIRPGISGVKATSAFIKMGSQWVQLATTTLIPFTYKLKTLLIDRQDQTINMKMGTLVITNPQTSDVDSCAFTIDDLEGTNKPEVGQEVLLFHKTSASAEPVIEFGGRISSFTQNRIGVSQYSYDVECIGFVQELSKGQVSEVYEDSTVEDIVADILGNNVKGLGGYYVDNTINVNYISFGYESPLICIQKLCSETNSKFYVDYERNLHIFSSSSNDAPYELNETLFSGDYQNLIFTEDKTQLINIQTVRGGYELSATHDDITRADGTQLTFKMDYKPFSTPTVAVSTDAGANWTPVTIGVDNTDDENSYDFLYNATEKLIKNLDHALLSAGHLLRAQYKYQKKILQTVMDTDSIETMKLKEGGDGKYYGNLIVDETIQTKAAAIQRGNSVLVQFKDPIINGSFTTTQDGYRAGQNLVIDIPSRDIDDTYIIQNVTKSSLGTNLWEYEVTFATKAEGLTELLISLIDKSKDIFTRTDQTVDTLRRLLEAITISSSVPAKTETNVTTNPYVYGSAQYEISEYN